MAENQSLHDLILLIRDGDFSSFEAIYEIVRRLLETHLLRKYQPTLDEEDVKDVIQDTVISIQTHAYQYHGPNAEGWVYAIAHSIASKTVKAYQRYEYSLDEEEDDRYGSSAVPERSSRVSDLKWEGEGSVEDRAIRSSELADIQRGAKLLSPKEQDVMQQRYEEEKTFKEIGGQMDRTPPWAKQKHDDAVSKIRSFLRLD